VIGDGSDMRIGADVELVLRRYAFERGVPVYGFKARVVADATGDAETAASPTVAAEPELATAPRDPKSNEE
jgi:hypothetical protein